MFKNAPTFLKKKDIGYMFTTNFLLIEQIYEEFAPCFTKRVRKVHALIFWQWIIILILNKIGVKYCVFPTKQYDICDYSPKYSMSGGLTHDRIIINLFMNITEKKGCHWIIIFVPK